MFSGDPKLNNFASAAEDFRRARSQADLKELVSRLTGASNQLLSFNDVYQMLKLRGGASRGLAEIPLDAIVGSVGRYNDFTRDFLPRRDTDRDRWARVKVAATGLAGLPPIDVYKIGETYFVKDGNHRVSVARRFGATHIEAFVTEVQSRVNLTPEVQPDDLILKAEQIDFLEQTHLDKLRPGSDLSVTVPARYPILLEHIEVHRYFMGLERGQEVPHQEAVTHWYDSVYLPVIDIIREQGILRYFPGRTETDLYLWIARYRALLEAQLGWEINVEHTAEELVNQYGPQKETFIKWIGEKIANIFPGAFRNGPPAGEWRVKSLIRHPDETLFAEILVPINGKEDGWFALDQALVLAKQENSILHGLHVIAESDDKENTNLAAIQADFAHRCTESGVKGSLVIAVGEVVDEICRHARWTDLVVVNLSYAPDPQPLSRISSGFHDLIQRCPRPILATPQTVALLNRPLLAYAGGQKAQEALFVATYLAGKRHLPLSVVSVDSSGTQSKDALKNANKYIKEHSVNANLFSEKGSIADAILRIGESMQCDFLIMGGYERSPLLEMLLSSTVNEMLRTSQNPMLICR